ncbi:MAG TPA: SUMF1/EgtB/PvdO family nonheme iron enzyme [Methylomirabilota bacterium]|nr:SUMF1/EgtB/PvdO family nonheme iron enzyme [Methylomirabilota bacterium]
MTRGTRVGLALVAALGAAALTGLKPGALGADGMMLVQAGAFWMGSDADAPNERPLHRVFVRDFWIDRHKVTNREFAAFLNARGIRSPEGEDYFDWDDPDVRIHGPRRGPEGPYAPDSGFEDHPAVEVSWFGARDYCLWRGWRLPTEAEWEKAARGNDKRPYPWGHEPPTPEHAVYGRVYNATASVQGRPAGASSSGVEDLLGNLREWTATEYRPYPYRADDGRENNRQEAARVVRGASHDDPAEALRVTIRRYYEHRGVARGHHHIGFRCATSEDLGGR